MWSSCSTWSKCLKWSIYVSGRKKAEGSLFGFIRFFCFKLLFMSSSHSFNGGTVGKMVLGELCLHWRVWAEGFPYPPGCSRRWLSARSCRPAAFKGRLFASENCCSLNLESNFNFKIAPPPGACGYLDLLWLISAAVGKQGKGTWVSGQRMVCVVRLYDDLQLWGSQPNRMWIYVVQFHSFIKINLLNIAVHCIW